MSARLSSSFRTRLPCTFCHYYFCSTGHMVSAHTVNTPAQASSCREQCPISSFFCTYLQGMARFPPLFSPVSSPRCPQQGGGGPVIKSRQPKQRLPLQKCPLEVLPLSPPTLAAEQSADLCDRSHSQACSFSGTEAPASQQQAKTCAASLSQHSSQTLTPQKDASSPDMNY